RRSRDFGPRARPMARGDPRCAPRSGLQRTPPLLLCPACGALAAARNGGIAMTMQWNWVLVVAGALLVLLEVALGGFAGFDLVLIGSAFVIGGLLGLAF